MGALRLDEAGALLPLRSMAALGAIQNQTGSFHFTRLESPHAGSRSISGVSSIVEVIRCPNEMCK
jgi:hypothetical protein